jgi:hypothetical protein
MPGLGTKAEPTSIVPLALFKKDPLRGFSARFDDGQSIPILGKGQSSEITAHALYAVLKVFEVTFLSEPEEILRVLKQLAAADPDDALWLAQRLIVYGSDADHQLWEPSTLPENCQTLLNQFASEFLVLAVVPENRLGTRQIIKLAYSILDQFAMALGYRELIFDIPMLTPYAAQSYHLEFHTPSSLSCVTLAIPDGNIFNGSSIDFSQDPIAHVHAAYVDVEAGPQVGEAHVRVPLAGPWFSMALTTLLGLIVSVLAFVLPGSVEMLQTNTEYSAALFFGLALAALGLLISTRENALETYLHRPLRTVLLMNALLLFVQGTSYAGNLRTPEFWFIVSGILLSYGLLTAVVIAPRLPEIWARFTSSEPFVR